MIDLDSLKRTPELRKDQDSGLKLVTPQQGVLESGGDAEPDIVVPVVRVVVVAISRSQVLWILIVPGTAAHHL